MHIKAKVIDNILKPREAVFDAIINPEKITGYFASHSSGPLKSGDIIVWKFEDVGVEFSVKNVRVESPAYISFDWKASGQWATVKIELESINTGQTAIKIKEGPFGAGPDGIKKALQQTQGWTDFSCSLKAWLYTGVNLRNGQKTHLKS